MNSFYLQLQAELTDAKEELWARTQIDGVNAGTKILLKGEPENTDSVFTNESDERIFQERISRPAKLVICGAGHVSMPIIRMGKMLGFHVMVVEDRPKFADDARRAEADQVYCEPFEDGLAKIKGDTDTWFVIVTRGHRYDTDCLRTILGKPGAYVGMMGSKRRTAIVKDQLEAEGFEREVLEAVHIIRKLTRPARPAVPSLSARPTAAPMANSHAMLSIRAPPALMSRKPMVYAAPEVAPSAPITAGARA